MGRSEKNSVAAFYDHQVRIIRSRIPGRTTGVVSCALVGSVSPENVGALAVLDKLLEPIAFDFLRTQKALGYVVYTSPIRRRDQLLHCVIVQGEKSVGVVGTNIEAFYKLAERKLGSYSDADFEGAKSMMREMFLAPFPSAEEEAKYTFLRQLEGFGVDFAVLAAKAVDSQNRAQMVSFFEGIYKSNPRRVVVQTLLRNEPIKQPKTTDYYGDVREVHSQQ